MASEYEVSILIPVWRPPKALLRRAIQSAIRTNAAEILVSCDDAHPQDIQLIKELAENDQRIKIFSHDRQLGLWENHAFLLRLAKQPWIKFLQQDDTIARGGLAELAKYANSDVAIISSLPTYASTSNEALTIGTR